MTDSVSSVFDVYKDVNHPCHDDLIMLLRDIEYTRFQYGNHIEHEKCHLVEYMNDLDCGSIDFVDYETDLQFFINDTCVEVFGNYVKTKNGNDYQYFGNDTYDKVVELENHLNSDKGKLEFLDNLGCAYDNETHEMINVF